MIETTSERSKNQSNKRKREQLNGNLFEKFFVFLSTADPGTLNKCPSEIPKYAAIGATLLVPFLFGMAAAAYAVSTVASNPLIIAAVALLWGFVIITIDRALLGTYKAHAKGKQKLLQFILRFSVAVLMGLSISHPLTLRLFQGQIDSEIARVRMEEMAETRSSADADKAKMDARIEQKNQELQDLQREYRQIASGEFLNQNSAPQANQTNAGNNQGDPAFADIDQQITRTRADRDQVQTDLNRWQKTFDEEISGARSGRPGQGPLSRQIERDELAWRRTEIQRLNGVLSDLTNKRNTLSANIMARNAEANAQIQARRQELEKQKLEVFQSQQKQLLEGVKSQIESVSAELADLRGDASQLTQDIRDRVGEVKGEARVDLMTRSVVLHHLFEKEGGGFAMAVYGIILTLFTLVDTIPLIVKFFSTSGQYDHLVELRDKEAVLHEPEAPVQQTKIARKIIEKRNDFAQKVESWQAGIDSQRQSQEQLIKDHKEKQDRLIRDHQDFLKNWAVIKKQNEKMGIPNYPEIDMPLAKLPPLNLPEINIPSLEFDEINLQRDLESLRREQEIELFKAHKAAKEGVNDEELEAFIASRRKQEQEQEPDTEAGDAPEIDLDGEHYFNGKFRFRNNEFFKAGSKQPNRYAVVEFSQEEAKESAKWLLQQVAEGKEKISLFGGYWDKGRSGKFNQVSIAEGERHLLADENRADVEDNRNQMTQQGTVGDPTGYGAGSNGSKANGDGSHEPEKPAPVEQQKAEPDVSIASKIAMGVAGVAAAAGAGAAIANSINRNNQIAANEERNANGSKIDNKEDAIDIPSEHVVEVPVKTKPVISSSVVTKNANVPLEGVVRQPVERNIDQKTVLDQYPAPSADVPIVQFPQLVEVTNDFEEPVVTETSKLIGVPEVEPVKERVEKLPPIVGVAPPPPGTVDEIIEVSEEKSMVKVPESIEPEPDPNYNSIRLDAKEPIQGDLLAGLGAKKEADEPSDPETLDDPETEGFGRFLDQNQRDQAS